MVNIYKYNEAKFSRHVPCIFILCYFYISYSGTCFILFFTQIYNIVTRDNCIIFNNACYPFTVNSGE